MAATNQSKQGGSMVAGDIGINVSFLLAGFLGALVNVNYYRHLNWKRDFFLVFIGAVSANYLTPLAVDWLHIVNPNTIGAVAFLIGMSGLRFVEIALFRLGLLQKRLKRS